MWDNLCSFARAAITKDQKLSALYSDWKHKLKVLVWKQEPPAYLRVHDFSQYHIPSLHIPVFKFPFLIQTSVILE